MVSRVLCHAILIPTFCSAASSLPAQIDFDAPYVFPAGQDLDFIRATDLNADGFGDLVTGSSTSPELHILLSSGTDELIRHQSLSRPTEDLSIADLNQDGLADLVIARSGVVVHHGLGGGLVEDTPTTLVLGVGANAQLEDVNGDGLRDIAGARFSSDEVAVSFAIGGGQFGPPIIAPTVNGPELCAVGDFDGDGMAEIAVQAGFENLLRIHKFVPATQSLIPVLTITANALDLVAADLDSDGRSELIFTDLFQNSIFIYSGSSNSILTFDQLIPLPFIAFNVEIADADGDGHLDILTTQKDKGKVVIAWGAAGINFPSVDTFLVGGAPADVTAVKIDGQGVPELAIAHSVNSASTAPGYTSILPAAPTRQFPFPRTQEVFSSPGFFGRTHKVGATDLDGDGILDLVCLLKNANQIRVLKGQPGGEFTVETIIDAPPQAIPTGLLLRDFNEDGFTDIVVSAPLIDALVFYAGSGLNFVETFTVATPDNPGALAAVDFNADGHLDIFSMADGISTGYLGDGTGAFQPGGPTVNEGFPGFPGLGLSIDEGALIAEDFNGDGNVDVAMSLVNEIRLFWGTTTGGLVSGGGIHSNFSVLNLAYGDATGDGTSDLIGVGVGHISIWPQMSTGLGSQITHEFDGRFEGVAVVDLDGDSEPDLVASDVRRASLIVLRGSPTSDDLVPLTNCSGDLMRFGTLHDPTAIVTEDFDNDGDLDLHVLCRLPDSIVSLENLSTLSFDCDGDGILDHCEIELGGAADTNSNGVPDECEALFVRGDASPDALIDVADPIRILQYLFEGATAHCLVSFDTNDDDLVDLADALAVLNYLFELGPEPPPPFPGCDIDPTGDTLSDPADCANPFCP